MGPGHRRGWLKSSPRLQFAGDEAEDARRARSIGHGMLGPLSSHAQASKALALLGRDDRQRCKIASREHTVRRCALGTSALARVSIIVATARQQPSTPFRGL